MPTATYNIAGFETICVFGMNPFMTAPMGGLERMISNRKQAPTVATSAMTSPSAVATTSVSCGPRVRTRISASELGFEFVVTLDDPRRVVRRIIVETVVPAGDEAGEVIAFSVSRSEDTDPHD